MFTIDTIHTPLPRVPRPLLIDSKRVVATSEE